MFVQFAKKSMMYKKKKNIIKTDVWSQIKVIYIGFLFYLKWTHPIGGLSL